MSKARKRVGMSAKLETWMPEARQIAAQCWCDATTSHLVMDCALAEAVARRIAAWMETGAFHARNEAYWRERALRAEGVYSEAIQDEEKDERSPTHNQL